jgi:hypothetical protein
MKNQKIANYLKTGILFLGMILVFNNCQKEDTIEPIEPNSVIEKIQSRFKKEDFKGVIPYKFDVNWKDNGAQYSEELKTSFYEFDIIYTSGLTPHINDSKKVKGNYYNSYKVIATKDKEEYNFYALRVYEKISETGNSISKVSFNAPLNFNGLIHLVDKEGDMVFARKVEKGENTIKNYFNKEFKELDPIKSKVDENCVDVVTYHLIDWYKKWNDAEGLHIEYTSTQLISTSVESICAYVYLPDYDNGVGGSGGGGGGTTSGVGVYKTDCTAPTNNVKSKSSYESDGCVVKVTEEVDECPEGMVYNADLKDCECPEGKVEDSTGKCVDKKPCVGDPVLNPEVAPQTNSGTKGGMFGKTRNGGTQWHKGLDLKNAYGKPIYALYSGAGKIATQYKRGKVDGAGHYVEVTSTLNGKTVKMLYFHMQQNNRISGTINAGDIIGYQGDSGNLKNAISQGHSVSHLHIKAKENGIDVDPIPYLKTKIDPNTGQVTNPCN